MSTDANKAREEYEARARAYFDTLCADLEGGRIVKASWGPFEEDEPEPGVWINTDPCIKLRIRFDKPREFKHGFTEKGFLVEEVEVEVWADEEGNGPGMLMFTEAAGVKE